MKRKLYELKNARTMLVEEAETALNTGNQSVYDEKMAKIKGYNVQIEQYEQLIEQKEKTFSGGMLPPVEPESAEKPASLTDLRKSNEYVRAWHEAAKKGIRMGDGRHVEKLAPLYKALSLSGGTTPGEDGGFLAPLDFELRVIELMKEYFDFSTLVNVENVSAMTGWRNVSTAGTATKLPKIAELAAIGKTAQPSYRRVTYSCDTYADRLVVSKQLANDASGLMESLAQWWAVRKVLTINDMVTQLLHTLPFNALAGATDAAQVKALKTLLNVSLNTAHSKNASIVTNQSGYDVMDNWVDLTGRAMLVPDLKCDFSRFKNRPVHYCDNDLLEDVTIGEEEEAKDYHPIFIGNFKAFATLFLRNGMVLDSTDVGGDAWTSNALEFRASCDMDIQQVDTAAVINAGIEAEA